MWLVRSPEQVICSLGIAAQMRFLASAKHHDLVEAYGLRMFHSKHADTIKLACQQTCARAHCGSRNYEHQHALAGYPAITVFQKNQLHPFITVRTKLIVIRRIPVSYTHLRAHET